MNASDLLLPDDRVILSSTSRLNPENNFPSSLRQEIRPLSPTKKRRGDDIIPYQRPGKRMLRVRTQSGSSGISSDIVMLPVDAPRFNGFGGADFSKMKL